MSFARVRISFIFSFVLGACLSGCVGFSHAPVAKVAVNEKVRVPTLLYHHLRDLTGHVSSAQRRWTLSPKKFEAQLEWIAKQGYQPITMAQLVAHLRHGNPLPGRPIIITFDDGWKDHYEVAFPLLQKYNFVATFFVTTDSVGHAAFVSWEQLAEMSAAGMDIQPHSLTHPYLSKISAEKAFREIAESKQAIEQHLNIPAIVFAYPYGVYTEKIIEMVKAAGYEGATTLSGYNSGYIFRKDEMYTLIRFAIASNDNLARLAQIKGF